MKFYIEFLDSKNNFKQKRKDFDNYESAKKWLNKTIENSSLDMIKVSR